MSQAYEMPRASEPTKTPVRRHGKGTCQRVAGVHVLSLAGTFAQMGEQHGALLAAEVARGPIPYYRQMVERLVGKSFGRAAPLMASALQAIVGARVEKAMPDFAVQTARGIARGAGLDEDAFLRGCTMPDSLLWVVARMQQLRDPGPAVAHRLALGLGCTSAVAWGAATKDGKLYHARNFDYYGVENWAENAAVIFHAPEQGLRYVSVAAAGVGLGGITAMNEAGLTLTVHQHMFTDRTALGGLPIGVVGDMVMREASNLREAEAILQKHRSIGCWTYVVTSASENRVLCFEENPERKVARRTEPGDSTFSYANIYLDPELGATELNLYGSYWRHNMGRHARAGALLREGHGSLDAYGMAKILADTGADKRCRVRDSIAMVMTVGSVVFRAEDGIVWLGVGNAPVSRGTWIPFSLKTAAHAPEAGTFEMGGRAEAQDDAAFEHYRRGYLAYVDRGDVGGAAREMERAAETSPAQSVYRMGAGLLAIESADGPRALRWLSSAIELGHPDEERVSACYLWRGRARDLCGDRAGALADYRGCLARRADRPVHDAARKNLGRPYSERAARRIHVEMSLSDVVMP